MVLVGTSRARGLNPLLIKVSIRSDAEIDPIIRVMSQSFTDQGIYSVGWIEIYDNGRGLVSILY